MQITKFAHSNIVQRHGPYNTPLNQDTYHLDTCHKVQRIKYTPGLHLLRKLTVGTWCSLTHMQETLLQLTLKTFFSSQKEKKKSIRFGDKN